MVSLNERRNGPVPAGALSRLCAIIARFESEANGSTLPFEATVVQPTACAFVCALHQSGGRCLRQQPLRDAQRAVGRALHQCNRRNLQPCRLRRIAQKSHDEPAAREHTTCQCTRHSAFNLQRVHNCADGACQSSPASAA